MFQPSPLSAIRRTESGAARKSSALHRAKGGSLKPQRSQKSSITSIRRSMKERSICKVPSAAWLGPGALDGGGDPLMRLLGAAPTQDLDPLAGLEIFVMG